MLGANPRKQLIAQLFGVVAGACAVVPAFNLLVPRPEILGSKEFPAPAVMVWGGVSKVLVDGIGGLSSSARIAAAVGALVGITLVLVERFVPKKWLPYVPSANALGIAMVVPASNAFAMFAGSAIAEYLRRKKPAFAERTVVPVASGFIAGRASWASP